MKTITILLIILIAAGTQAKGILEFAYGYHYCNCLNVSDTTGYKSSGIINPDDFAKAYSLDVKTAPNPAQDWVAFNFTLPNGNTMGVIEICDVSGKFVTGIPITEAQGQKVWDTRKIKSGVYFYTLNVSGFNKTGKIIISK